MWMGHDSLANGSRGGRCGAFAVLGICLAAGLMMPSVATAAGATAAGATAAGVTAAGKVDAAGKTVRTDPVTLSATSMIANRASARRALAPINLDASRFAFTSPGQAPAPVSGKSVERSFTFTPSGKAGKGVSVAMTSRHNLQGTKASGPSPADLVASSSRAYDLDLAVGLGRFALSGGVRNSSDEIIGQPQRRSMDVGVSYGTQKWRTSLQASAEPAPQASVSPERASENYSVEAGGAFVLSPRVTVGGGVRYRMAPSHPTALDVDKNDRAVFVGGELTF